MDGTPSDELGHLPPDQLSIPEQPLTTSSAAMLAFLIADIRGYTRYTAEKGNQAAGQLVERFAEIVHAAVKSHGGKLIELRGDEALTVFRSARSAALCALALRDEFIDETLEHPERPLPVGIELDVGEAVRVERGYRGAALNIAARHTDLGHGSRPAELRRRAFPRLPAAARRTTPRPAISHRHARCSQPSRNTTASSA